MVKWSNGQMVKWSNCKLREMKAFVLREDSFALEDYPESACDDGFVRAKVLCAGLNHRDQYIREGLYSKIKLPAVLGSDISAVVDRERVIVDPSMMWGDDERAQGPLFNPIGMPSQGGLAEYVCVPRENIYPAPSHLTDEEVAAIPIAGVTAWRGLMTRGQLKPGETILITGIGGGVATMAMKFALAVGARVIVTSRSEEKTQRALELGAHAGHLVRSREARDDASHAQDQPVGPALTKSGSHITTLKQQQIDVVFDSVGGDTFNEMTDVLRPGGRYIVYGSSMGKVNGANLHRVFWKQLTILGTSMGTARDFAEMLAFIEKHKIVPVIDSVYELADTQQAFDHMKDGGQFGKIVVRVSTSDN